MNYGGVPPLAARGRDGGTNCSIRQRVPSAPGAPGAPGGQQAPTPHVQRVQRLPTHSQRAVSVPHPHTGAGPGARLAESKNHQRPHAADPSASTSAASPRPALDAEQAAHRDGWALLLRDYSLPQLTSICHVL